MGNYGIGSHKGHGKRGRKGGKKLQVRCFGTKKRINVQKKEGKRMVKGRKRRAVVAEEELDGGERKGRTRQKEEGQLGKSPR